MRCPELVEGLNVEFVALSCDALSVTLSLPKCLSKGRRVEC
jgi:hypothetical protein